MGFSEAGNHGKPWFSRLPDQLLKRTAVTFGWRLFSGSSFVVEEARCRASGFECIGPLGGRDGFAFGKPLRRWNQGLPFGLWDRIHEGPTEHIVLLRYGPDAVRAGPRHVLPGLRVPSIGWRLVTRDCKLMSIGPRQMVSFGVRQKSGWPLFVSRSPCNPLQLCYNENTNGAVW